MYISAQMSIERDIERVRNAEPAVLDQLVDEHVFGRDLSACTPSRRKQALLALLDKGEPARPKPDGTVQGTLLLAGKPVRVVSNAELPPELSPLQEHWIWAQREGKPWQKELEKEMAGFRFEASQGWSSSKSMVVAVMDETIKRLATEVCLVNPGPHVESFGPDGIWICFVVPPPNRLSREVGGSAPLAVCRACVIACLQAKARAEDARAAGMA